MDMTFLKMKLTPGLPCYLCQARSERLHVSFIVQTVFHSRLLLFGSLLLPLLFLHSFSREHCRVREKSFHSNPNCPMQQSDARRTTTGKIPKATDRFSFTHSKLRLTFQTSSNFQFPQPAKAAECQYPTRRPRLEWILCPRASSLKQD